MGGMKTAAMAVTSGLKIASDVQQAKTAAKLQSDQISQQNAITSQQLQWRADQQRNLLKQQAATARASLGAQTGSVGSGSGVALLAGLTRNIEGQIAHDATMADLRMESPHTSSRINRPDKANQAFNILRSFWDR